MGGFAYGNENAAIADLGCKKRGVGFQVFGENKLFYVLTLPPRDGLG